jgi:AsmA protein
MPRILRNLLIGLTAALLLLVVLALILVNTFNPNDYKPQIIELVQKQKQRTLAIPGEIKLTLFPSIGADLGKITLSERGNARQFAAVERARVSLALLPLFKKKFVVDKILIDGVQFELVRDKSGKLNIDDLLAQDKQEPEAAVQVDISSIQVSKGQFVLDDQMQQRRIAISQLNLKSGRIASGVPGSLDLKFDVKSNAPKLDAQVKLASGFTIDMEKQVVQLEDTVLEVLGSAQEFTDIKLKMTGALDMKQAQINLQGFSLAGQAQRAGQRMEVKFHIPKVEVSEQDAKGDKITLEGKLAEGTRNIALDLKVPSFKGSKTDLSLPGVTLQVGVTDSSKAAALDAKASLAANWSLNLTKMLVQGKDLQLTLSGKQGDLAIDGKLAAQLQADLARQSVKLNQISSRFTLPSPKGRAMNLALDGNTQWEQNRLSAQLKGKLDASQLDLRLGMAGFPKPMLDLNLVMDQLDLNHYQPEPDTKTGKKPAAQDAVLDLSPLADLRLKALFQLGQLKLADVQLAQVRAEVHADGGKLALGPLAANLYGGRMEGQINATASNNPQIQIKQRLTNVALGPLLKDAIKKSPIDGKAQVTLDLETRGARISQLKQALSGSARIAVQDGAVSGFNLAQIIRTGQAAMGAGKERGEKSGTAGANDKTDFSELSGSFKISAGVARNDDLSAKSPLFRIAGNGDINIGQDSLNYLVKPTVVATLQGQGGPELQALKGITIPVRLSGPFTHIGWEIDMGALVLEVAKQKIDEKVKGKINESILDKVKGLFK